MADYTCPKCRGTMHSYERNGVTIEQCGDCRGLFLDRGELERLVDAENRWHSEARQPAGGPGGAPPPPHAAPAPPPAVPYGQPSYGTPAHGYSSHGYRSKRKKSFLDELFD